MISKKSITTIAISSVFAITLSIAPLSMANDYSTIIQAENKGFMIAEAYQHGQEKGSTQQGSSKRDEGQHGEGQKHRHGQDKDKGKESEHGGHKEGKDKDDHDHDKVEGGKHDHKKNDGMMKGEHDYAHMLISHTDALKLSDEQLGKIIRLHLKHKQEHEKLKQKLHKSMKAFHKKSMQPSTSDDQLLNLSKELISAFNEMVEFHIKERQAVHAILSDDQKNQLKTLKMDHDTHGDKDGKHGGHG